MDPWSPTLEGRFVRLEPLTLDHERGFLEAGAEWDFMPEFVRDGIATALRQRDERTAIPFATIERASGRVAGGTRLLRIAPEHRRLEIGATWLGRPWRRSALNTEAKLLMLGHAFEAMGCLRVEFRADTRNRESRAALLRIGAVEEGILRHFEVGGDETPHDVAVSSILAAEWPATRIRLRELLDRPR